MTWGNCCFYPESVTKKQDGICRVFEDVAGIEWNGNARAPEFTPKQEYVGKPVVLPEGTGIPRCERCLAWREILPGPQPTEKGA